MNIFKRIKRNVLRAILRGYIITNRKYGVGALLHLKDVTAKKLLDPECFKNSLFSIDFKRYLLGGAANHWDLSFAQFFYSKIFNIHFNKLLLYSYGAKKILVYPLPRCVLPFFIDQGVKISSIFCWLMCLVAGLANVIYGTVHMLRLFFRGLLQKRFASSSPVCIYYFYNLDKTSVPQTRSDLTAINWYINYKSIEAQEGDIKFICHGLDVDEFCLNGMHVNKQFEFSTSELKLQSALKLFLWYVTALVYCIYALIATDDPRVALMFKELVDAAYIRYAKGRAQFKLTHLFNLTSHVYRPLWTYEAELNGDDIIFYFYSTNTEAFKLYSQQISNSKLGYDLCSWPNVFVWDLQQELFVKSTFAVIPKHIIITNPIHLSDKSGYIPVVDGRLKCALFDVQPHRFIRFATILQPHEYYRGSTSIKFIHDVMTLLSKKDILPVLKRKREIGNMVHPGYHRLISDVGAFNCYEVSTQYNPVHVINDVDFVIAMPFTAVAKQSINLGKPIVYYDPFAEIIEPEKYAHGIHVVTSFEKLEEWIDSVVDTTLNLKVHADSP